MRSTSSMSRTLRTTSSLAPASRTGPTPSVLVGLTVLLLFLGAPMLLDRLGISQHYLPLFYVDLIGVSVQVVFMALLNVFFYLDKRRIALELCLLFVLLNTVLTLVTLYLGPTFFGYGFTVSLIVCVLAGLVRLNGALQKLEYSTFMLEH